MTFCENKLLVPARPEDPEPPLAPVRPFKDPRQKTKWGRQKTKSGRQNLNDKKQTGPDKMARKKTRGPRQKNNIVATKSLLFRDKVSRQNSSWTSDALLFDRDGASPNPPNGTLSRHFLRRSNRTFCRRNSGPSMPASQEAALSASTQTLRCRRRTHMRAAPSGRCT